MAQLNDTMVQGDLRVTGTVFGTTANIPDIYTNDKIAYGDATGQSVLIASRVDGGLPNMNVYEATSLNGFVTPLTKYSKVSSDSYKCEFDSIIGGNDGTTDYPMWHNVTYAGTNSWTSNLTRLLTATSSISSTDDLEPLLTVSRGVVKSSSTGTFPTTATGTSPSGNILGFNCVSWASLGSNQYGIVFHGDNARTGLTYNNSYILGTNASFPGVSDIGYDSTSHYFQGMSQSARKAKYADMALSGGALDNTLNDKMNKDASNADAPSETGTGATATLLNNLTSTSLGDITSDDVCIPTTNSDGSNTNKWYKRPLSYLWPWIKSKLTGSDVNIGGSAKSVTNYLPQNRTCIWGQAVATDRILDIGVGNYSYNTTFLIIFSTSSTKWPSIISVSCRYEGGSSWNASPKASIIYNTNASNDSTKPLIKQHIYDGKGHILLQPVVSRNTETQCTIIAASGDVSKLTIASVLNTNTLWTDASAITDIEQNVSKTTVGSAIGDTNTPVYVAASGFVQPCGNVYAKKIYDATSGNYLSIRTGVLGTDTDTIYIL